MRCISRLLAVTGIAATAALSHAQTLGGGGGPAGDAAYVEKCEAPKGSCACLLRARPAGSSSTAG
jgi:hypothetical protein